MRLIDADALKERLLGYKVPDEPIANQAHKELIYAIDSLPTVCDIEQIRAEIDEIEINGQVDEHTMFIRTGEQVKQMALNIIDRYTK